MNISEIQNKILELKKEKDVCILAHSYQAREICEIADFTGDSYKLSVDASKVTNKKHSYVRCSFYGRNLQNSFTR